MGLRNLSQLLKMAHRPAALRGGKHGLDPKAGTLGLVIVKSHLQSVFGSSAFNHSTEKGKQQPAFRENVIILSCSVPCPPLQVI